MRKLNSVLKSITTALPFVLLMSGDIQAATFSSTKAEILRGYDYTRGPNFSEVDETILTIANASGFTYGDSYFFADVTNASDRESTGGTHLEFGPRLSLLRTFGSGQWDGVIKDIYGIVQADFTSNRFTTKTVLMGGLSVDWRVPGFRFVKTHIQHRDDPNLDGDSVQFNLVWNSSFNIGSQKFSFEGFADWTSSEGTAESNLLVQPQLLWHYNKNIAAGLEYQYWENRLGIDGLDEKAPQLMVRWTF